jgi:AraC-like DNA-binding protein
MDVTLHKPGPALADCVESIVHFSGFEPDWQREKLLPDGRMELVIDLTDRAKRLFHTEQGAAGDDFRQAWLSGVHRRPIVIEAQSMASMLVIAFRPGGAAPLLGGDMHDLTDHVAALDAVIGRSATSLRDRILEAPSGPSRCLAAEAWLMERAGGCARRDPLVAFLAREMAMRPGSIAALMDRTGHSHRHIQALARRSLGIPLKTFARIERFQRLLANVGWSSDWADLAAAHGYVDQSHLIHEFRAFAGMTPAAYAAHYAGLVDFLPIRTAPCANLQDGPARGNDPALA